MTLIIINIKIQFIYSYKFHMHNWKIQIIGLFINFLVLFYECAPKHCNI